jgi:hypothetical protein
MATILSTTPMTKAALVATLELERLEGAAKVRSGYTMWFAQPQLGLETAERCDPNMVRVARHVEAVTPPADIGDIAAYRDDAMVVAWRDTRAADLEMCRILRKAVGEAGSITQAELGRRSGLAACEAASGRAANKGCLTAVLAQNAVHDGYLRVERGRNVIFTVGDKEVPADATEPPPDFSVIARSTNRSAGEATMALVLSDLGYKFTIEHTDPTLCDQRQLRFDFHVETRDEEYPVLLIEVQGDQHYIWTRHFHKTEEAFRLLQHHDQMKKDWALENEIPLLCIKSGSGNAATRKRFAQEVRRAMAHLEEYPEW